MKIRSAVLETVCGITSTLPENTLPEVAFCGRSNVGKSSLINALMGRRRLARTSSEPGKTQTLNFYNINGEIYLVDLPGYGYARVSEQERQRWGEMVQRYLETSEMLRAVFLLTDIRHEPSEQDLQMKAWVDLLELACVILATKADKLTKNQIRAQESALRRAYGLSEDDILLPVSARSGEGIWEVGDLMSQILENESAEIKDD